MILNPCCEDHTIRTRAFACYYDRRGVVFTHGALGTAVITLTSYCYLALSVIHKTPVPGASGFGKEECEN